MYPEVTAKLTAIGSDSPLHRAMNPDGQKEPIEERRGGSVTGEAENPAKNTFSADVLYSVYASHLESDEEASRGAEAACSLR